MKLDIQLFSLFGGGAAGGSFTGYNREAVEHLREVINTTAQECAEKIVDLMHSEIVAPMSKVWYAKEAVEYFESIQQTVKASGESITNIFDSFREEVQTAGVNWATKTHNENDKPSLAAISPVSLDLNVSDIQDKNSKGDVVIDINEANSIAGKLPQTEEKIKTELEQITNKLDAAEALLGGSQAQAVKDCFNGLCKIVGEIFKFISSGDQNGNSITKLINEAAKSYGEQAEGTASQFNISE